MKGLRDKNTETAPALRGVGQSVLDKVRAFAGGHFQDDACLVFARRL